MCCFVRILFIVYDIIIWFDYISLIMGLYLIFKGNFTGFVSLGCSVIFSGADFYVSLGFSVIFFETDCYVSLGCFLIFLMKNPHYQTINSVISFSVSFMFFIFIFRTQL